MLTENQKNVIIGGILGDSCIEKNGQNYRIIFDHSISQLQYIAWKNAILFPHATKLQKYKVFDARTEKTYEKAKFKTYSKNFFNEYYFIIL